MFLKRNVYKLFLILLLVPLKLCAYSDYIIASGENIGIKLDSKGVIIVGTYEVSGKNPASSAGLKVGDIIEKINNNDIKNIDDMINEIKNSRNKDISITYKRGSDLKNTILNIDNSSEDVKTGLYVKDSITGIGTLTYIDPNTKKFGALGHEIMENSTKKILDINSGTIFPSTVTGIVKAEDGYPGEKNATFDLSKTDGNILENTNKGIFGNYISEINEDKLYKVVDYKDVNLGKAKIKTVLSGNSIGEYDINIISVTNSDKIKNIIFEITDKELVDKTNGIIQGMSGSPIIQGDNIVGAVTHVVIDNPLKGYGILITNMLEEGEN